MQNTANILAQVPSEKERFTFLLNVVRDRSSLNSLSVCEQLKPHCLISCVCKGTVYLSVQFAAMAFLHCVALFDFLCTTRSGRNSLSRWTDGQLLTPNNY